jgi:hypothetical protein
VQRSIFGICAMEMNYSQLSSAGSFLREQQLGTEFDYACSTKATQIGTGEQWGHSDNYI